MKRMILAAMLLAMPLTAQPTKADRITKLVRLNYVEPRSIINMLSTYGVTVQFNDSMKAMTLNGTAADVAGAEAAIKQLDIAPKSIELTVYFVMGGDNPQQMVGAPPVPADVKDVITQLKNAFTFKEYRMLDVLTLRTRTGAEAETSGILNTGNPPKMSQFSIRNVTVGDDGLIRIDHMHAGLRIPYRTATTGTQATKAECEEIVSGLRNVAREEGNLVKESKK